MSGLKGRTGQFVPVLFMLRSMLFAVGDYKEGNFGTEGVQVCGGRSGPSRTLHNELYVQSTDGATPRNPQHPLSAERQLDIPQGGTENYNSVRATAL